jgi:hypothetical protein
MPRKQVKTSGNPTHICRFMVKQIKKGTRTFILHLNDEALLLLVNHLEDKLKNFKKNRKIFEGVQLFATLSTSDDVRQSVSLTKHVKEHIRFQLSPFSQVLSTLETGDVVTSSEEPVKKTSLVVVSDKINSYYDQAIEYFKDSTNVKNMRVIEIPSFVNLFDFRTVNLIIDNPDEMKIVAKCLSDNNFVGTVNVINATKDMLNVPEFKDLLSKKGVKCKSLYSGVKFNVDEGKFTEFSRPYDKQVLEMISVQALVCGEWWW